MPVGWVPSALLADGPSRPGHLYGDALACLPVIPARLLLGEEAAWIAPLAAAGFASVLKAAYNIIYNIM